MNYNHANVPVIAADERDRAGNLSFYCHFCKEDHHHSNVAGHYGALCKSRFSPYAETGYILARNRTIWDKGNKYAPTNKKKKEKVKLWNKLFKN
ncbi:hypothetical protein [Heyndrickxia acidicola]|uniref:Uncharacterized protein n=1 Tax=Heyndrickxia acidicola TaxID=209389 RepID=A0ABU6MMH2_9BACI|nr:hypothetical protein [Heyndrickxia acidicola]MED1205883.1 hypothetical protein [Heyndrickxia acidicola]